MPRDTAHTPNPLTVAVWASERLTRALVILQTTERMPKQAHDYSRQQAWDAYLQVNAAMAPLRPAPVDPLVTPAQSDVTDALRALNLKAEKTIR